MGFFKKLFGLEKKQIEISVSTSKPDSFDSPTQSLLKEATQKKKASDLPGAIKCLKSAYNIMCDDPDWFSVGSACKLPLYLQQNKQEQEAWETFLDIVKRCDHYALSTAYDKMRLFLQRSGKPVEAVKYGIFSHLVDMASGYMVNKEIKKDGGYENRTLSEMSSGEIESLLKKAKKTDLLSEIETIVNKYSAKIPKINFVELDKELHTVLYRDK